MFDWFPITEGRYLTATQYCILMEFSFFMCLAIIFRSRFLVSMSFMAFIHFNTCQEFSIFIIILINGLKLRNSIILLVIMLLTSDVCMSMHNRGQGAIFDFENVTISTAFSRWLFAESQEEHVYITLGEDDFIFINVISINQGKVNFSLKFNGQIVEFQRNQPIYQAAVHVRELNNTIQIELNNICKQWNYIHKFDKVIFGGDLGNTEIALQTWKWLQNNNIDLLVLGGDIAYDNANPNCYLCWDRFFSQYELLHKDRLIPMIIAIGNHDAGIVQNAGLIFDYELPPFMSYFQQHSTVVLPPTERRTHFVHKLPEFTLITLDSYYIAKPQDQIYNITTDKPIIIQYHVPIIPTAKNDLATHQFIEQLKETLNLAVLVFENHKHNLKYSKGIRLLGDGQTESGKTVYLGNGAMGVVSRKPSVHKLIDHSETVSHFYLIENHQVFVVKNGVLEKLTPVF